MSVASEHVRAFVALPLPGDVRAALVEATGGLREADWARRVRWVREEGMHLTLKFLGGVETGRVAEIVLALRAGLAQESSFGFALSRLGLFPTASRPRVVAAEVGSEAEEALTSLAAAVEDALAGCGFEPEGRSFRAHVTLGRFRRPERKARPPRPAWNDRAAALDRPLRVEARAVILFRSTLLPTGAVYHELGRAELADAGGHGAREA